MKTWLARWYKLALLSTMISALRRYYKTEPDTFEKGEHCLLASLQLTILSVAIIGGLFTIAIPEMFPVITSLKVWTIYLVLFFSFKYFRSGRYKGRRLLTALFEGTIASWAFVLLVPVYAPLLIAQLAVWIFLLVPKAGRLLRANPVLDGKKNNTVSF